MPLGGATKQQLLLSKASKRPLEILTSLKVADVIVNVPFIGFFILVSSLLINRRGI